MKRAGVVIIGTLLLVTMCSGCVTFEKQQGETQSALGSIQLRLTDKPADFEILHANVTISTVQVHKAEADQYGDDEEQSEGNETEDEDGFVVNANGEYQAMIGEDIQFLGSASGGVEPYNWSWDFGDDNTSDLQNPLHNYSSEDVYMVNLTVTDNNSVIEWDTARVVIGENESEDDSDEGWYTIGDESKTFDLMQLQNVSEVLGEKNLSVGKYTQIRLTVVSAEITINVSGEIQIHQMKIPSGSVKLVRAFWIYENETTVLTLDFDVNESVHQTGKNQFIMKPTIKIIET